MGNGASTTTTSPSSSLNGNSNRNNTTDRNSISTSNTSNSRSTNRENNSNSMLTGSIITSNATNISNEQHNNANNTSTSSTTSIMHSSTNIGTTNGGISTSSGTAINSSSSVNTSSASTIIQNGIVLRSTTGMIDGTYNSTNATTTNSSTTNRTGNITDWPVSRWLGVRTELDIFDDDFLESIPYPNGIATSGIASNSTNTNSTTAGASNLLNGSPHEHVQNGANSITTILNNMNLNDEAEMLAPTLNSNIGTGNVVGENNTTTNSSSSSANAMGGISTITTTTTSSSSATTSNAGSSKLNVRNSINGGSNANAASNNSKHSTTLNMALWMADVNNHVLSQHAYKTLAVSLSRQCRRSDAFSRRIAKQLFALQHVHSALTSFSLNVEHIVETRIRKQNELLYINTLTSPTSKRNNIVMHGNNLLNNDGTPCDHDAKLGISLFFTLLDCVNDEDATLEERQAFLYDLNPLIQELGLLDSNSKNNNTNNGSGNKNANDIDLNESIDNNASNNLSLSSLNKDNSNASINSNKITSNSNSQLLNNINVSSSSEGKNNHNNNNNNNNRSSTHPFALFQQNNGNLKTQNSAANLGILDAIRDFLYSAALPSVNECELLNEMNVLNEKEKMIAGKLQLQDRTSAITSLIALACVRGSLCDLLMAVKILLCVSWSEATTCEAIDKQLETKREEEEENNNTNSNNPSTNNNDDSDGSSSNLVNDTTVLLKRLNPIDSKANEDKKNKLIKKKRGQQQQQTVQEMLEDREEQLMIEHTVNEMKTQTVNRVDVVESSSTFNESDDYSPKNIDSKSNKNGNMETSGSSGSMTTTTTTNTNSNFDKNVVNTRAISSAKSSTSTTSSISTITNLSSTTSDNIISTDNNSKKLSPSSNNKNGDSNSNSSSGKRPGSSEASEKEINKKKQLLLKAKQRDKALIPGSTTMNATDGDNDEAISIAQMIYNDRHKPKPYYKWIEPLNVAPYLRCLENAKVQPNTYTSINGSNGRAMSPHSNEREVWTFGQNSYGELIQGDTATRKSPARVMAVEGKNIVAVCAGNEHTVLMTGDGLVYTAGYNDNGQCGQGNTDRVGTLTVIDDLKGVANIQQIHAYNGCEHTLAVSNDGKLFSFGYNYRGQLGQGSTSSIFSPRLVRGLLLNKKVKTVSCSYYHSVLSCQSGEIFAFGRNDFGQLGLGDSTDRKEPARVDLPQAEGSPARSIGCGQYHTMIATYSGHAYGFGKNDYGQLGLVSTECQRRPILLDSPIFEDGNVLKFRCGYYHTLCLLESSHVFSFGRNDYGQLGLGHTAQRVFGPQLIEMLSGKGIVALSAGCYHSVCIANSGALYVFGRNNHGQLGTGDDAERHTPWLIGTFTGKRVAMVACGFYHTIVLTGDLINRENFEGSTGTDSGVTSSKSGVHMFKKGNTMPSSAQGLLELPQYKLPDELVEENIGSARSMKNNSSSNLLGTIKGDSVKYSASSTVTDSDGNKKESKKPSSINISNVGNVNNAPNMLHHGNAGLNTPSSNSHLSNSSPKPHDDLTTPTSAMSGHSPFATIRNSNSNGTVPSTNGNGNLNNASPSRTTRINSVGSVGPNDPAWSNIHGNDASPSVHAMSPSKHHDDLLDNEDSIELDYKLEQTEEELLRHAKRNDIDPEHVAIFIMGHLDRLATSYLPVRGEYPSFFNTNTRAKEGTAANTNNSNGTFCVDTRPETFELLLSFFSITGRAMSTSSSNKKTKPALPSISKMNRSTRPQIVLACLKLLRANLAKLISDGSSINAKLDRVLFHLKDKLIDMLEDPKRSVGLTNADIEDPNRHLHGIPSNITQILYEIQTESANVLSVGLQLFYPTAQDIVELYTQLMLKNKDGISTRGKVVLSSFLLTPLTQRLSEDSMIVFLLMSSHLARTNNNDKLIINESPVRILTSSLLNHVADDASIKIIKALEEIDEAEGSFIDTTSNDRKKSIPTSTDNIHGSNGDNGSNINFIDLVLALQKHLLSSAGRDPLAYNSNYLHDVTKQKVFQHVMASERMSEDGRGRKSTKNKKKKRNRPGKIGNMNHISNDVEISNVNNNGNGGMKLLMNYTEQMISRVVEILTQISAWCEDNHGTVSPDLIWKTLESGLVGKILPSLMTGLILFSGSHRFSKVFLQPLTSLLALLDRLLNFNGDVMALEHARTQSLEESFDGQQNNHNRHLRNMNHHIGMNINPSNSTPGDNGSNTTSPTNATSSGVANVFNGNMKKPYGWIINLEKTIGVLTSRMAATLVTGEALLIHKRVYPKQNVFLDTLCKNGLEETVLDAVNTFTTTSRSNGDAPSNVHGNRGLTTSYMHFGSHISRANEEISLQSIALNAMESDIEMLAKQNEDELSIIIKGWVKHLGLSSKERREFAQLIFRDIDEEDEDVVVHAQVDSVNAILKWLKNKYILINPQYKMSLLQFRNNKDMYKCFEQVERTVAMTVIKHYGLTPDIMAYTRILIDQAVTKGKAKKRAIDMNNIPVPLRFNIIWKNVSDIRQWILRHRNMQPNDKTVDINTYLTNISREIINKCKALLCYKPFAFRNSTSSSGNVNFSDEYFNDSSMVASSSLITSPSEPSIACYDMNAKWVQEATAHKYDGLSFLRRHPRSKWRSVRSRIFIIVRWKQLTKCGEKMLKKQQQEDSKKIKVQANSNPNNSLFSSFVYEALIQSYCNRQPHYDIMHDGMIQSELAICRASGLYSYECLIKSVQLPSLKKEVIRTLGPALRDTPSVDAFIFKHLNASNKLMKQTTWNTFTSLFQTLTDILEHVVQHSSTLTHDQARLISVIMDAWGLQFGRSNALRYFVNKTGILNIVRKLVFNRTPLGNNNVKSYQMLTKEDSISINEVTPLWRIKATPLPRGASKHSDLSSNRYSWSPFVRECAWRLYRFMIVQVSAQVDIDVTNKGTTATVIPAVAPLVQMYDMLYDDIMLTFTQFVELNLWKKKQQENLVEEQVALRTISSVNGTVMQSSNNNIKTSKQYPRMAHSQDIIDAPHHIVPGETSFVVPAANVLPNNSQGDFSLTFWMLLTEDSIGQRRLILLRGNINEFNPLISLNPNERTIEVIMTKQNSNRQGNMSPSTDSERLPSKSVVPLHRWTHVAIVSEAAQLRLYINGVLDAQRTNYSGIYRKANQSRNPIYVGYDKNALPANFPIKHGMEGCLAKLRYHSRALSPIHVRVDCEKGPPLGSTDQIVDNHCYQMQLLLWLSVQTPVAIEMMSNQKWLQLLLTLLKDGTHRLKQCAIRVLRVLIPRVKPISLTNMFVNLSSKDIKFAGENIVNVLLDFVGLSVWPEINSVKQKPADLIMTTTTGIQRNQEDWMRTDEYGCPALEESNNSFIICSEIISLIQRLSKSSLWQDALEASLKAAIIKISKLVEGKDDGDDNDSAKVDERSNTYSRAWAALAVLGGHIDNLRIGGRVSLSHTNLTATVLSLDSDVNTCGATMSAPAARIAMVETQVYDQSAANTLKHNNALKAVRMNTEELRIIKETVSNFEAQCYSNITMPILEMLDKIFLSNSVSFNANTTPPATSKDVEHHIILSSTLKSLSSLLEHYDQTKSKHQTNDGDDDITNDKIVNNQHAYKIAETILQKDGSNSTLLQSLFQLSVVTNNSVYDHINSITRTDNAVTTIELFESKALLLRQRLQSLKKKWTNHVMNNVGGKEKNMEVKVEGDSIVIDNESSPVDMAKPTTNNNNNNEEEDQDGDLSNNNNNNNIFDADQQMANELAAIQAMHNEHDADDLMVGMDITSLQAPPAEMVDELMAMGFPEEWCVTALRENGNDMVSASTWIVDNLDMLSQLRHEECDEEDDDDDASDDDDDDDDDDDEEDDEDDSDNEDQTLNKHMESEQHLLDATNRLHSNTMVVDDLSYENYFPNDATQENNMYNQYSQQSDFAGYGSGSRLGKFASVVSSISICDSVKQIEQAVVETETILSSLYSQQIILSVFGIYLEQYNNNETTTNNDDSDAKRSIGIINAIGYKHDLLLNFIKFVICRNPTVVPADTIIPLKLSSCICIDTFKHLRTQNMIENVIVQLLIDEFNATKDGGSNSMSFLFLNALVERSISELNNTLLFLETDVIPIHSNGLGKPSAYFSKCLINTIFDQHGKGIFTYHHISDKLQLLFDVLCKSTMTNNMHYNSIVYDLLAKILFLYCNVEFGTIEWCQRLPAKELKGLATERLKNERSNGRMILSPYLQSLLNLNVAINEKCEEAKVNNQEEKSKEDNVQKDLRKETTNSFIFDRMHCGPSIDISNNGHNATFSSSESWSTVLGNVGFMIGKNHWKIRIERSPTAYLFVGIATKDANLSTFLGGDENGWGYIGDRALYHKRNKVKLYGERFGQGDVIGVTLDMDEGTLSFDKNGEDLGVAITNLVGVIYPAVAFYNRGQQVQILPEHFDLPGAGVDIPGAPSSVSLDNILSASTLLRNYTLTQRVNKDLFLQDIYLNTYKKWYLKETFRYLTQSGYDLQFDTNNKLCVEKYGLTIGEQVPTLRGVATVIGIGPNGKLWRSIEGEDATEKGVWFFSQRELDECKVKSNAISTSGKKINDKKNTVEDVKKKEKKINDDEKNAKSTATTSSSSSSNSSSSNNNNNDNSSANNDNYKMDDLKIVETTDGLPFLTMETFSEFISIDNNKTSSNNNNNGNNNEILDNTIVDIINQHCTNINNASVNKQELSPWNVTPKILNDKLLPLIIKRVKETVNKYQKTPTIFQHNDDRKVDVDILNVKQYLNFTYISARFALLSYLNDRIIGLLPLSSMANEYKKPILNNSYLSYNKHCIRKRLYGDIGNLLATIRGSIFFHTKYNLLTIGLRRTTTRAKKAEDDYDYPEDLPQVVLNRPKAILARNKPDPETRLSYSVFGQSFDELHFLEPASLRMGYTHPMDDGQERTFKVKFEGEGVDDYGGPYREFFSQIIEELQSKVGDSNGGYNISSNASTTNNNNSTSCVLPLLVPCPNQQNSIGENQKHFVLNPSTVRSYAGSAQLYIEMYNFLGQILGIALRSRVHLSLSFPSMIWKVLVGECLTFNDLMNYDENVCIMLNGLLKFVNDDDVLLGKVKTKNKKDNKLTKETSQNISMMKDILHELGYDIRLSDGTNMNIENQFIQYIKSNNNNNNNDVQIVEHVVQYAITVVRTRLLESKDAMKALRDGLLSVVPADILPILTWEELEETVCGKEEIDIDLLRLNTEYDDDVSADDQHILWMWEILKEWDHEKRRAFLRFVWARSHLPPTAKEFKQKFKIQALVGDGPRNHPDKYLPKAHTCFFSINLPLYSNKEVLREKLLFAIYNCLEMDADFRLTGNESVGWTV